MAFHISVQKLSPTSCRKSTRDKIPLLVGEDTKSLNIIATYGNEGNFILVNIYGTNR